MKHRKQIKSLVFTFIAFLFLTATAFAEKVTFVKEYNYNASDLDSKVSSRAIALEQVKRLLLEALGTYLISETEVKNFRLTKDQVTTYSAGVVSAEVMDERWDGKTYYLKAKVSADPAEVAKSLQNIANDKQKSKELEDVRKKAGEFSKEIERLKKELVVAKTDTKQPEQKADTKKGEQYNDAIKESSETRDTLLDMFKKRLEQFDNAVKGLSATDWFEKGYAFDEAGNYKEAINAYNGVIELAPLAVNAYHNRGLAYAQLGNHQQAINDFNKEIELNPLDAEAYYNRGITYGNLGNYQQAINDYTKAIQLNPKDAAAYYNRGLTYGRDLGNQQQAINDYNKAIELKPQYAKAYNNRGLAYAEKGQYDMAVEDFNKAIQLNPQYVEAYNNRGNAYHNKGKYDKAIEDYNKAIALDPNLALAYYNRGIAYAQLKNYQKTIEDYEIAARLGHKKAQDFLRQNGINW